MQSYRRRETGEISPATTGVSRKSFRPAPGNLIQAACTGYVPIFPKDATGCSKPVARSLQISASLEVTIVKLDPVSIKPSMGRGEGNSSPTAEPALMSPSDGPIKTEMRGPISVRSVALHENSNGPTYRLNHKEGVFLANLLDQKLAGDTEFRNSGP